MSIPNEVHQRLRRQATTRAGFSEWRSKMKPFLLFAEPRWLGFKLMQEGNEEAVEFDSITEAFAFAKETPECEGAPFVVFDDKGKEMVRLTV